MVKICDFHNSIKYELGHQYIWEKQPTLHYAKGKLSGEKKPSALR